MNLFTKSGIATALEVVAVGILFGYAVIYPGKLPQKDIREELVIIREAADIKNSTLITLVKTTLYLPVALPLALLTGFPKPEGD